MWWWDLTVAEYLQAIAERPMWLTVALLVGAWMLGRWVAR